MLSNYVCNSSGPLEADQLPFSERKEISALFLVQQVCFLSMLCIHPNPDSAPPLLSCYEVRALNWGKPAAELISVVLTQEKYRKTTVHIGISRGLSHRKME